MLFFFKTIEKVVDIKIADYFAAKAVLWLIYYWLPKWPNSKQLGEDAAPKTWWHTFSSVCRLTVAERFWSYETQHRLVERLLSGTFFYIIWHSNCGFLEADDNPNEAG
jgi:hypothetical protein